MKKFLAGGLAAAMLMTVATFVQAQTPAPATPATPDATTPATTTPAATTPAATTPPAGGNLAAAPAVQIALGLTGATPVLSTNTFELITGEYYRLTITTDGGAEVLFESPTFFQNIWMNQIVVAGMEIKLWGGAAAVAGVEVGEGGAGNVQITFVTIRPGTYQFWIDEEAGIGGTFIVR